MSNRTTYEQRTANIGQVELAGQCNIGSAGAVTGLTGNGMASIAKTATGVYTLTLQDGYRKLLSASSALVSLCNRTEKTAATGAANVDTTANTIKFVGHGFATGRIVALSIDSGSLPAGLSATNYYVIVVDADKIKFATSLANAEAGTAEDITDTGTASKVMTVTPVAPVGSGVAAVEVSAYSLANKTIELACYDYAGALVQPANGSVLHFSFQFIDTSVPLKGE